MSLFETTAEDYLKLIGNWEDPNGLPLVEQVILGSGITINIVRDDIISAGSKARAADYLIGHAPEYANITEWVYGSSPATGYAQVSLPWVCSRYRKKAVIFMAERSENKLTNYQMIGKAYGAEYMWVPNGMLNVTEKRARDYVAVNPKNRALLPIGLDHPYAIACLIKTARNIQIVPDVVWCVYSSGTLCRALQAAWPNAEVHAVHAGGHSGNVGRAIVHKTNYRFDQEVHPNLRPYFPCSPTYDAKAWAVMNKYYYPNHPHTGKNVLFWNVAG